MPWAVARTSGASSRRRSASSAARPLDRSPEVVEVGAGGGPGLQRCRKRATVEGWIVLLELGCGRGSGAAPAGGRSRRARARPGERGSRLPRAARRRWVTRPGARGPSRETAWPGASRRRRRGGAPGSCERGPPASRRRPAMSVRTAAARSMSSAAVGARSRRPVAFGPGLMTLAKRSTLCSTSRTARASTGAGQR